MTNTTQHHEATEATNAQIKALFDSFDHNNTMAEMVAWNFVGFDSARAEISLSFEAKALFANPMGAVHGGFVATMLDEVMVSALFAAGGGDKIAVTITSTVDFIRPVMLGPIAARGRVRHMGKRIAFLEGELYDREGALLAKSSGSFKVLLFSVLDIKKMSQTNGSGKSE
jgi:uncharacterized protein (TIGR00369 family)